MIQSRSAFRASPPEQRRDGLRRLAKVHQWNWISQRDVAALLTDDWSGAGLIHLDGTLPLSELEAAGAVMLANARSILEATRAAGVAPAIAPDVHSPTHNAMEPAVDPLHWAQVLLEVGGLLTRSPAGFTLTDKGGELLDPERAGALYVHLFRTLFRRFNLAYLDRFPELPDLQDLVPHWLWVLTGPLGAGFTSADTYVQVLIPRPLSDDLDERAAPARLRHLIQTRVLDPLADLGLLEVKQGDDETEELGDVGFRPTRLYRRFLRVDITHPDVQSGPRHLKLVR